MLISLDHRRIIGCEKLISDHVLFWYHDINKFGGISEVYDHFCHITFVFKFNYNKESIKGCGVFPVYESNLLYTMRELDPLPQLLSPAKETKKKNCLPFKARLRGFCNSNGGGR